MDKYTIVEKTGINEPIKWLNDDIWVYLSSYSDERKYTELDDMYRLIEEEISFEEYSKYNYPDKNLEEVKNRYEKEFPLLLADALKDIADDIEKGNIVIKFDECKL